MTLSWKKLSATARLRNVVSRISTPLASILNWSSIRSPRRRKSRSADHIESGRGYGIALITVDRTCPARAVSAVPSAEIGRIIHAQNGGPEHRVAQPQQDAWR